MESSSVIEGDKPVPETNFDTHLLVFGLHRVNIEYSLALFIHTLPSGERDLRIGRSFTLSPPPVLELDHHERHGRFATFRPFSDTL